MNKEYLVVEFVDKLPEEVEEKMHKDLVEYLDARLLFWIQMDTESESILIQAQNENLGRVKASGLNDRKQPHISNIGSFTIVQSRELSRWPKFSF